MFIYNVNVPAYISYTFRVSIYSLQILIRRDAIGVKILLAYIRALRYTSADRFRERSNREILSVDMTPSSFFLLASGHPMQFDSVSRTKVKQFLVLGIHRNLFSLVNVNIFFAYTSGSVSIPRSPVF